MLTKEQQYILQEMGIPVWEERKSVEKPVSICVEQDWESFKQEVMACTKCLLSQSRQQVVFGAGNPRADLLIIGEAPGAEEDHIGEPFVGRSGRLLDAMLAAIDLKRQDIYIANILKCRPPNNRDPSLGEIATCTPYLERQIAEIQPKLILALGRVAAHYLLGVDTPLGKLRGQLLQYGTSKTDMMVTYHPAYLLRAPREKGNAYQDMLAIKRRLDEFK